MGFVRGFLFISASITNSISILMSVTPKGIQYISLRLEETWSSLVLWFRLSFAVTTKDKPDLIRVYYHGLGLGKIFLRQGTYLRSSPPKLPQVRRSSLLWAVEDLFRLLVPCECRLHHLWCPGAGIECPGGRGGGGGGIHGIHLAHS